jgi:hypothetical protein
MRSHGVRRREHRHHAPPLHHLRRAVLFRARYLHTGVHTIMGVYANLSAVTFLASEVSAVQLAPGYEDLNGQWSTIISDLAVLKFKLARLQGLVPAGANLTAIATAATALA